MEVSKGPFYYQCEYKQLRKISKLSVNERIDGNVSHPSLGQFSWGGGESLWDL